MRSFRVLGLLALMISLPLIPAVGQEEVGASPAEAPVPFCFNPSRAPRCRGYLITEVSYTSRDFGDGTRVQWELGGMVNLGRSYAIGGTLTTGARTVRQRDWGGTLFPDGTVAREREPRFVMPSIGLLGCRRLEYRFVRQDWRR